MEFSKKHNKLASDHQAVKYNFIITELDLAITFCDLARSSNDGDKIQRNTDNAQRAYDAALHFLKDSGFSAKMRANVQRKVTKLKGMLRRLSSRRFGATTTSIARRPAPAR